MTHPLTPREKVAEIVRDGMSRLAASQAGARPVVSASKEADRVTDAILTTLASGSGDHAELARLASLAMEPPAASVIEISPATVLALLAENAALRAERAEDDQAAQAEVDEYASKALDWEAVACLRRLRSLEAERKLAEADRLLERIANDPTWDGPSSARLYFLSKEAERG